MTTYHGRAGQVYNGANQVGEVNEFSVDLNAEFADDTQMSDTDKTTHSQAIKSGSGQVTCWWDKGDTNGQEAITYGNSVTLNLRPEGTGVGLAQLSFTARVTNEGIT